MPFSKENIRFTVLVIGFVCVFVTTVTGVAAISYSPTLNSTPLITAVIGLCSIQLLQLLTLLRTEQTARQNAAEIVRTRHDLKNELQPIKLEVGAVDQQLRNAPCTTDELKAAIRDVLRENGLANGSTPPAPPASGSPPHH